MSDAKTHVDILRQELVRGLVFLEEIRVDAGAGEGAAEEEAEETAEALASACYPSPSDSRAVWRRLRLRTAREAN